MPGIKLACKANNALPLSNMERQKCGFLDDIFSKGISVVPSKQK